MTCKPVMLGAAIAAGLLSATPSMATTLVTSLAAFDSGIGAATVTSTPNPGSFDLTQLFLPTTSSITLGDGSTLGLSNTAQVTQPQNGFPYLLSDGFAGEIFIPLDANANQVSSETIVIGTGVTALGFEVAPFSSASGAPFIGFAGGPYNVTVTLSGGLTQTVSLPGGIDNLGTTQSQFFGFTGGGVSSLTITTSDPNGLGFGNFVDVHVPEPASAALLPAGLTALFARGRRQSDVA